MQNIATIGDNSPPSAEEILAQDLRAKHDQLLTGAHKLIEAADRLPTEINDDETAGKAGTYIKQLTGCAKNLEANRVNEKLPFLTMGKMVDGFFKTVTDSLDGAKMKAQRPLDSYLKRKAAEEHARRMEEARKLRDEALAQAAAAHALEQAKMSVPAAKVLDQSIITEQQAQKAEQHAAAKPAEMAQSRSASGALASLRTIWVGELADIGTLDLEKLRHHLNPADLQKAINSFVRAGGRELAGAKIYESSQTVVR